MGAVKHVRRGVRGLQQSVFHGGRPVSLRGWLGYPRAAWLIIAVEFWERFSFYGMLTILALFLTGSTVHGGFGWSATQALALVGAYSGAMYAFPVVGGYLADRKLGHRRAVTLGASFMLLGQILMASPTYLPALLGAWHHLPLLEALGSLGAPLGHIVRTPDTSAAIAAHGIVLDAHLGGAWLSHAYTAQALGFYAALVCLILGNALMKSTLVVLCGETFEPSDPLRDGAYAYYYLGISCGAMLSGVVVGLIAQKFGWAYGFAIAALGMATALFAYIVLAPRWLGAIGVRATDRSIGQAVVGLIGPSATRLNGETGLRIALLVVLAPLLCVFSVSVFQLYGSWSLFVERFVERSVGSFLVPVPWFSSLSAAVNIIVAPVIAALWVRLAVRKFSVDIVWKYAFALAAALFGQLLMYGGALSAAHGNSVRVWVPILAVAVHATGEVVAWTASYGIVSRVAPPGFASLTMGAWYLVTLGLGGYLSGFAGNLLDSFGFASTFGALAAVMLAATIAALLLHRPLVQLAARAGVRL